MKNPMHAHIKRRLTVAKRLLTQAQDYVGGLPTNPQTLRLLHAVSVALMKVNNATEKLKVVEENDQ